jgi:hypothetical protein
MHAPPSLLPVKGTPGTQGTRGWLEGWAGLDKVAKRKISTFPGIKLQFSTHLANCVRMLMSNTGV